MTTATGATPTTTSTGSTGTATIATPTSTESSDTSQPGTPPSRQAASIPEAAFLLGSDLFGHRTRPMPSGIRPLAAASESRDPRSRDIRPGSGGTGPSPAG